MNRLTTIEVERIFDLAELALNESRGGICSGLVTLKVLGHLFALDPEIGPELERIYTLAETGFRATPMCMNYAGDDAKGKMTPAT
jgi:hypothetical protein